MNKTLESMSVADHHNGSSPSIVQKIAVSISSIGLVVLALALLNLEFSNKAIWLIFALLAIISGIVLYANDIYLKQPAGIKFNGIWFKSLTSRGMFAWILGIVLTLFYVIIYWFPQYLGYHEKDGNTGLVSLFDPLSIFLNGKSATQWFVYGTLYTVAILSMGYKFLLKYRDNKYQVVRTLSVMFFQLGFAFLIPEILSKLNPDTPYFNKDIKNMWPLNYYFFEDWHMSNMLNGGNLGIFMLIFGLAMIFLISPVLTYFYGKRWYCSWVCGCGGLAETAGDPFRHLSDKSSKAWKFERWSIHLVLVLAFITSVAVLYTFLGKNPDQGLISRSQFTIGIVAFLAILTACLYLFKRKKMDKDAVFTMVSLVIIIIAIIILNYFSGNENVFFVDNYTLTSWYGFAIGALFSGVIGVGFYPIMGSRVWCRFGCPMAAILGLQQRLFSRFRITTNGGQCISCGNCSNACEMGIDVRAYAQKGENIVRSSCVGCGICSAVCPRGVLKLENGADDNRINANPVLLGNDVNLLALLRQGNQKK
ncbi:MAG: 4Fe-4S dicluster domain-containing protein [Daejeonella sp.]|uniref:4Fe-4S binding protein n=1 Tax=Daejeonella sp. TaxID=2805397 RepID=UPI003C74D047